MIAKEMEFDTALDQEILTLFQSQDFDGDQVYFQVKEYIDKVDSSSKILTEQMKDLSLKILPNVTSSLETLERIEKKIQQDVMPQIKIMLNRVDGLRDSLIEPYNRISSSVLLLKRLKITCDLLRKVTRVLNISRRIQQKTSFDTNTESGLRDLIKSAQLLNELNQLLESDQEISKINEVSKELESVNMIKGLIIDKCHTHFKGGINSVEVTTGKIN
jgi:hypothetical protein